MEFLMNDIYLQGSIAIIVMVIALIIRSLVIGPKSNLVHVNKAIDTPMLKAKKLNSIIHTIKTNSTDSIDKKAEAYTLFRAENKLKDMLINLIQSRDQLKSRWREHYANLGWWEKLTSEIETDEDNELITLEHDRHIQEVETALSQFAQKYKDDIEKARNYFSELKNRTNCRIQELEQEISEKISNNSNALINEDTVTAAWIAKLSIPLSATDDLLNAHQVYDALRSVNSNFAEMTDIEIWWETLWMSGGQLTGLISLTKGAYFERLVAGDTGGELHEHFNNVDTDIVLDGIAYQIKATDSASYIQSVDDDIPVIATSEVADITGAIDSGYRNEELTQSVELALGGSVVDVGDTVIDAILTGAGSLGFFATCRGINHTSEQFEKGVEADIAILEGIGVTAKGTAKGVVDLAEVGYKVTTSAPSRAIGRGLWAIIKFISRGVCKILP